MSNDYLPAKDRSFLAWVINFLKHLMGRIEQFGFPQALFQKLNEEKTDFAAKLEAAEEPATRTQVTVLAKNAARKVLETDIRHAVAQFLNYNQVLTAADRDMLGLPIHKTTHTPSPVAKTYPVGRADTHMLRRIIIHFADQHAGEETSKAKPFGQHGAGIRWVISEVPVVNVEDLTHSSIDTRTPFTLEFQGHERGKTVYFALCWENTRGEKGPYSPIGRAIIP
jgi:hypothetical protein